MSQLEIAGTILIIHATLNFPSGFQKREFVIKTAHDKYPQEIKFETVKDGCTRLDSYRIGDPVKVTFDIRGNEYNGKHFVSLQAWKIEREGQREQAQQSQGQAAAPEDDYQEDDEIPF